MSNKEQIIAMELSGKHLGRYARWEVVYKLKRKNAKLHEEVIFMPTSITHYGPNQSIILVRGSDKWGGRGAYEFPVWSEVTVTYDHRIKD